MLAQLLIQFQQPIVTEQNVNNVTNYPINDTIAAQLNATSSDRVTRSIPTYEDDLLHNNADRLMRERLFAPDYSGKAMQFSLHIK